MTYQEEQELLALTRANNIMLSKIMTYLHLHGGHTDDLKEFAMNVLANLISDKR